MKTTKQIWKFEIGASQSTIEVPRGAEILTVQTQNERACVWALVDPANDKEIRNIEVFGTGHDINYEMGANRKYIGTTQFRGGELVLHFFERIYP